MLTVDDIVRDLRADGLQGLPLVVLFRTIVGDDVDAADADGRRPLIFIPDLHILSAHAGVVHDDYFNLNHTREQRLIALLERLLALRANDAPHYERLKVYQLGDFHDLWRERQLYHDDTLPRMLQRQLEDHRALFEAFRDLGTIRLVGNHDDVLRSGDALRELEGEPIASIFPPNPDTIVADRIVFTWGGFRRVVLMHADQVDPAENRFYSHQVNPVVARQANTLRRLFPEMADEWRHEVKGMGSPDGPVSRALLQDRVVYDPDATGGEQARRQKFYAEVWDYDHARRKSEGDLTGEPLVAAVIGHTHAPRIVGGKSSWEYQMIDSGSWVNVSENADDARDSFWNAQFAVLTGREIAVIQVGLD